MSEGQQMPVLKIEKMNIAFTRYTAGLRQTETTGIRDLNLTVHAGEMTAVVGESGSGKSLLAHAVLGILPYNARCGGRMWYFGEELSKERICALRGNEIVLVPQGAQYLDPLQKVGRQILKGRSDAKTKERLLEILRRYHLKEEVLQMYPHELSGGMSRRILMAAALVEEPKLVIADEPTPGLDEKNAGYVMGHLREMADLGAGVLVITHDLELAVRTADRIVVFYEGRTVEETDAAAFAKEELLRHPYTKALWRAMQGRT